LLANTGLKYEYLDAQTVTILSATDSADAPPSTHTLSGQALRLSRVHADAASAQVVAKEQQSGQEIVVEGARDKAAPYRDSNVDLPRTIDDVKPYYIFDSET